VLSEAESKARNSGIAESARNRGETDRLDARSSGCARFRLSDQESGIHERDINALSRCDGYESAQIMRGSVRRNSYFNKQESGPMRRPHAGRAG